LVSSARMSKGGLQVFINESQVKLKVEDMSHFERSDDSNIDEGTRHVSVLAMAKRYEELHCQSRRHDRLPYSRRTTNAHGDRQSRIAHFTVRRNSAEGKSKRLYPSSTSSQRVSGGEERALSSNSGSSENEMVISTGHCRTSEPPSPEKATVCPWDPTYDPRLPEKAVEAPSCSLRRSPDEITEAPSYSMSEPLCTEPAIKAPYDPQMPEKAVEALSSSLSRSPDKVTEAPSNSTSEPLWTEPAMEAPSDQTSQLLEQVAEAPSLQTLEPQFLEDSVEAPTLDEETVAPSDQTSEHLFFETAADITDAGKLDIHKGDVTPVKRSLTKRFRLWLKKLSGRSEKTSKRGLITSERAKTTESSSHRRPPTTVSQVAVKEDKSVDLNSSDQRMSGIEEVEWAYEGDVSEIPLPQGAPPASSVRRMSGIEEEVWAYEGDVSQIPLPPGTPPDTSLRRITGIDDQVLSNNAGVESSMPVPHQQVFMPRRAISEFIAQRASELLRNGWTPGTPLDRKVKLTRPTPSWQVN
jgi:hypothetical protein